MKKLVTVVLLVFALAPRANTQGSTPYTTNFPLTESPISEGGKWINGQAAGLDWHNIRTNGTEAYGTQDGSTNYTDSVAVVAGNWGNDQTATATVRSVNPHTGTNIFEELELLLRFNITPHNTTGYEFTFAARPSSDGGRYVQINRWNGALGDFTTLDSRTGPGITTGTQVKATAVGTVLTLYVNNTAIFSVDTAGDSPRFASGHPGVGHYLQGGTIALTSDYGLTTFTASDSGTPPTAPTNLRILP